RWKAYSADEVECSNSTTDSPRPLLSHDVSTSRVSSRKRYSSQDRVPVAQAEFPSQLPKLQPSPRRVPGRAFGYRLRQLQECPGQTRPFRPYPFLPGVQPHFLDRTSVTSGKPAHC